MAYQTIKNKRVPTSLSFEKSTIRSQYVRQKLTLLHINRNEFRQFLNFYRNNPTNRLISRAHYNPTIFGIEINKRQKFRNHQKPQNHQYFQHHTIPQMHIPVANYYELLSKGIIPSGIQAAGTNSDQSTDTFETAQENFIIKQTSCCQICEIQKHTQYYSSKDINVAEKVELQHLEDFAETKWFNKLLQMFIAIKDMTIGMLLKLIIKDQINDNELYNEQPFNVKMCDECAIVIFSISTKPEEMQNVEKQIRQKGVDLLKIKKENITLKNDIERHNLESDPEHIFKNFSFNSTQQTNKLVTESQEISLNEAKIMNLDLQNTKLSTELNSISDKQSAEIGLTDSIATKNTAETEKLQAEKKLIESETQHLNITYSEKLIKSAVETLKFEREYEKLKEAINIEDIYGYVITKTSGQQINEQHEKYVAQLVNTYFDNKKFFDYKLIAWTQKIISAMYIRDTKYALSSYTTFTTKKTKQMPEIDELDKKIPTYDLIKNINRTNENRALKGQKKTLFGLVKKTNKVVSY